MFSLVIGARYCLDRECLWTSLYFNIVFAYFAPTSSAQGKCSLIVLGYLLHPRSYTVGRWLLFLTRRLLYFVRTVCTHDSFADKNKTVMWGSSLSVVHGEMFAVF